MILGEHGQPGKINDDIIHVLTSAPISLYSMNPSKQTLTCIDLYDIFPQTRNNSMRFRVQCVPLGFPLDSTVMVHEETVQ